MMRVGSLVSSLGSGDGHQNRWPESLSISHEP